MNDWKQKLKLRLPAVVLLVATSLFWSRYDRYEPAGPVLLKSPVLADGTNVRGDVSGSNGRFTLRVPPGGKQARIDFPMPAAVDYESIRVRARIKVDGVVVGKHSWSCARLLVAQYDANNKWIPGQHHGLVAEEGSKDWAGHEDVFEISPNAARVVVVLQQSGAEGTAEFEQIEAWPVRIRVSFIWWRIVFLGSWVFMATLYFRRCRLHHRKLRILILLNVLAILYGTLMPGAWIQGGSDWAKKAWAERTNPVPTKTESQTGERPDAKKIQNTQQMEHFDQLVTEAHVTGHFVLFATLCFLVYLSAALERQHPSYFFKVGIDVLLFAAITESLQFLTLDRSAGVGDLRIDLYGMAAALLVFLVVFPLVRRFRAKPSPDVA